MGLEQAGGIDAIGTERSSGEIILTIFDAWDWSDPALHIQALTQKLDAYFAFVERGQVFEDYPDAVGKRIVRASARNAASLESPLAWPADSRHTFPDGSDDHSDY